MPKKANGFKINISILSGVGFMELSFYMPSRVIFGTGAAQECAWRFAALGKRCLIVTGGSSARLCGALDDIMGVLDSVGIIYDIFDKIRQNPTVESCRQAGIAANSMGADFIVGIGGGSPLDAAKATAVFAANPKLDEGGLYSLRWGKSPLPVVLVGTTAGTGSEVTSVAVLTDSSGRKRSIRDDRIYPVFSLSDPSYTATLSGYFTRSTAVDAMAHCLESYFNKTADTMSRAPASYGACVLFEQLKKLSDGTLPGKDERIALYSGSILGGTAISSTGTAFPHAMGYFLSENHGIPHGIACAEFLPAFLKHCEKADENGMKTLLRFIGAELDELIAVIESAIPQDKIVVTDEERAELLTRWENNRGLKKTPGEFGAADADALIKELFSKGDSLE